MNINKETTLSNALNLSTYNAEKVNLSNIEKPNIYMGIGLWSKQHGLSKGLPVDVIHMLLTGAITRLQIEEKNPNTKSKIIILIADSMAVREGADKEDVSKLVTIYKKSLKPLLERLKIKEHSEILLSSALENINEYLENEKIVESLPMTQNLKKTDKDHFAYVRTQTTITRHMQKEKNVGIKVGWISLESSKEILSKTPGMQLKNWDELKFDRLYDEICPDLSIKCLYTKAGIKQSSGSNNEITVQEGCPYTAFEKNRRYIISIEGEKKSLKDICPLQRRVITQWKEIPKISLDLMEADLLDKEWLLKDRINKGNLKITISNILEDWINVSLLKK